jgi:hypothetical protein
VLSGLTAVSAFILTFVISLADWAWALLAGAFGAAAAGFVTLMPPRSKTKVVIAAVAVCMAAIGIFSTLTRHGTSESSPELPSCGDIGNSRSGVKDESYFGAFVAAYDRAGGRKALGCPRHDDTSGYVHKWGEGFSQDLEGQDGYPARLMVLPPSGRVIVLQGTLNRDYTHWFERNAAPQLGYPTSYPIACGNARIVPLKRGKWAPGVMITSSDETAWVWLARPFWLRYKQLGGPLGRLGLPVGQSDITAEEPSQNFEHGELRLVARKSTVRSEREMRGLSEGAPLHSFNCPGL